jgi:hypothetical protein
MGDLYIRTVDGMHVLPLPANLPPGGEQVAALVMERVANEVKNQHHAFAVAMATAAFVVTGTQQDKIDEATDIAVRLLRDQVRSWRRVTPAIAVPMPPAGVH